MALSRYGTELWRLRGRQVSWPVSSRNQPESPYRNLTIESVPGWAVGDSPRPSPTPPHLLPLVLQGPGAARKDLTASDNRFTAWLDS